MKLRNALLLSTMTLCLLTPATVQAYVSYGDIYADAVSESCARHDRMLQNNEISQSSYNAIGYALSDITGDGLCELIVRQVTGKHWAEYWVYTTDGSSAYKMGEFGCDARTDKSMYGYLKGVIYEEVYKGYLKLGIVEWDGNSLTDRTIYEGRYDRDGYEPTIPDLTEYYDSDRLLDEIDDFETLTWSTRVGDTSSNSGSNKSTVNTPTDSRYDLNRYGYKTVVTGGKGALVFQDGPNGAFMNDYQFNEGDQIYVNLDWRKDGYAIAYQNGTYGYVDAAYIDWTNSWTGSNYSTAGSGSYSSKKDLSNYGYRTVVTNGRGALVFQDAPNGAFMYDYQFNDGDSIYVNLDWRQDGYAIACQNGVYGYVDASYINWNSSGSGSGAGSSRTNLSNFGYRTVNTKGRGALVFQTEPDGSFMYDYQFDDGDEIYVNLNWRQDGYAIACKNGVYGYVDASYISW